MKKARKLIEKRFLNMPVNISIVFSFFIIILIQICFIFSDWLKEHFESFYVLISESELLTGIFIAIIPFIPTAFSLFFKKITRKAKANTVFTGEPEKTSIFPGFITQDMLNNNEVIFVKDRTKENRDKPMVLDRQVQCENIIKHINLIERKEHVLNCLFLTGNSGAGKSLLINNILKKKLKEMGDTCEVINDKYGEDEFNYNLLLNKFSVVIMDQFEDSLGNTQIYKTIKNLVYNSDQPILFIFSFPQEFFDKIHILLTKTFMESETSDTLETKEKEYIPDLLNSSTYFLRNDEYDIKQLIQLVKSFVGEGSNIDSCLKDCRHSFEIAQNFKFVIESNKYKQSAIFLCSILTRIEVGEVPLVNFSIVTYVYELYHKEIDKHLEYYIEDTDRVIDLYLFKWVNKFPNEETAQIILYLISDKNIYTDDDLKCVTFEPQSDFEEDSNQGFNIINAMKSNSFLSVKKGWSGYNFGVSSIHDYVGAKINGYCFDNLSIEIKQNVDHYRKIMSKNKQGRTSLAESEEKLTIKNRYENYCNPNRIIFINVFVFVMMILSLIAGCYTGNKAENKSENIYVIWNAINCMLSTYYIYNIIMHFLRILDIKQYLPVTLFGTFSVIVCFIVPRIWGMALGIEVIVLGGTFLLLQRETVNIAKSEFRKKGGLYIFFGALMFGLGLLYLFYPSILYHIFFLMYIVSSNFSHIHYNYMISKIGQTNTI